MGVRRPLLVNQYEKLTHAELTAAAEQWGLTVHPKVRVADVVDPTRTA